MARALGLPGCDFADEPFRGNKLFKPTKKVMFAECKRRMQRMNMKIGRTAKWQFPASVWNVQDLADWLRRNAIDGAEERCELARRVRRLADEVNRGLDQIVVGARVDDGVEPGDSAPSSEMGSDAASDRPIDNSNSEVTGERVNTESISQADTEQGTAQKQSRRTTTASDNQDSSSQIVAQSQEHSFTPLDVHALMASGLFGCESLEKPIDQHKMTLKTRVASPVEARRASVKICGRATKSLAKGCTVANEGSQRALSFCGRSDQHSATKPSESGEVTLNSIEPKTVHTDVPMDFEADTKMSVCEKHYLAQTEDEERSRTLLIMAIGMSCCQSMVDWIMHSGKKRSNPTKTS